MVLYVVTLFQSSLNGNLSHSKMEGFNAHFFRGAYHDFSGPTSIEYRWKSYNSMRTHIHCCWCLIVGILYLFRVENYVDKTIRPSTIRASETTAQRSWFFLLINRILNIWRWILNLHKIKFLQGKNLHLIQPQKLDMMDKLT